jgi:hypothetical protein
MGWWGGEAGGCGSGGGGDGTSVAGSDGGRGEGRPWHELCRPLQGAADLAGDSVETESKAHHTISDGSRNIDDVNTVFGGRVGGSVAGSDGGGGGVCSL